MKKLLVILLAMITVLSLFAGCKPQDEDNDRIDPETGKMIITIGVPEMMLVKNYDTNVFTLWLEEQCNVDLRFHLFPTSASDYKTQLSVMSLDKNSKMPDILVNFDELGTAFKQYGDQGYFLDLTEYFEDREGKGKMYWDAVAESGISEAWVKDILRRCQDDEGRYFGVPRIETSHIDNIDYMPFINQEWLTRLNLEMPKDTKTLYEVLKAFKQVDWNGNGFPDEYPLVGGEANGTAGSDVINWIINMFLYYDDTNDFNLSTDGKTLTTPFTTDAYRQAMIYCNKLRSEGLLEYDWSYGEISSKLNKKNVGIAVVHPTLAFSVGQDSIDPYVAMPIWGTAVKKEYRYSIGCFITESALDGKDENPEVVDKCWEILCTMCTKEGSYRQRYGEKGVDWTDADEGTKSMLGWDADIKLLKDDAFTGKNNQTWKDVAASLLPNAENESVQLDESTDPWMQKKFALLRGIYESSLAARERNPQYLMPKVVMTDDEMEEIEFERRNCKDTVLSYRVKFISGELDPNKNADWNTYINELNGHGLTKWKNHMQKLYNERYMASVLDGTYGNW